VTKVDSVGDWVIGEGGFSRSDRMRRNLDSVCLRAAALHWPDVHAFEPWMSSRTGIERAVEGGFSPEGVVKEPLRVGKILVISEEDDLQRLRSLLGGDSDTLRIQHALSYSAQTFRRVIPKALWLIEEWTPQFYKKLVSFCVWIGPLSSSTGEFSSVGRGRSSHTSRRLILTEPPRQCEFEVEIVALNLAHEVAHQVLQVYQASDSLIEEASLRAPVFSVIRRAHRPAILSFHAVLAAVFMTVWAHEALASPLPDASQREWLKAKRKENAEAASAGFRALDGIPLTELGGDIHSECIAFLTSIGG
jgi:hypothetical protein